MKRKEDAFFAMMGRLKYINRWALMRNSREENLGEHSLETAMIAHALCIIGNRRLGKSLDQERAAVIAMYHDASEIITGDMPTPIKYLNQEIRKVYKEIEHDACGRLLEFLPEDLRGEYEELIEPRGEEFAYERKLVKAADKLSAYIKCIEEKKAGNHEFLNAERTLLETVRGLGLKEAEIFLEEFLPAYGRTIDEM